MLSTNTTVTGEGSGSQPEVIPETQEVSSAIMSEYFSTSF